MVKKNGAKVYGNKYVTTKRYQAWQKVAQLHLAAARNMYPALNFPIRVQVRAQLVFNFANHMAEADLSALYEGIQDELQKMGILKDDKLIMSHDGSTKTFGGVPSCQVILYTY